MTTKKLKPYLIPFLCIAAALLISPMIFGKETIYVLSWYFGWLFLTISALPLVWALFPSFSDRGYIFSKTLGLVLAGGLLWALSVFHVLTFTRTNVLISCILLFAASCGLFLYRKKKNTDENIFKISEEALVRSLYIEGFFLIMFLYWSYLRGNGAAAYDCEKFMDYGFLMSMFKSKYLPAEDIWYAGKPINYYYMGQYFAAFMTKLTGVKVNYGYNLMLMSLPSLGFLECFTIVRTLLENFQKNIKSWIPLAGGIVAGAANTFAGNMHYVIYCLLHLAGKEDGSEYVVSDSVYYIGYNPDVADKAINEFPAYSIFRADLHAHVVNFIFVLTLISLLLSWMQQQKAEESPEEKKPNYLKNIFCAEIIIIGIMIGLFQGTNYWDFPIYYVVSGAIILFTNIVVFKKPLPIFFVTAGQGVLVMGLAQLAGLPFRMYFEMITSKVLFSDKRTPAYQFLIVWGLPVLMCLAFYLKLIFEKKENKNNKEKSKEKNKEDGEDKGNPVIMPDLFMVLISLCAIGLIIMPELVYVYDIYGDGFKRFNTMFKLTYQASILFGLSFGYMLVRLICFGKKIAFRTIGVLAAVLFTLTLGFFPEWAKEKYGGILGGQFDTLDAAAFLNLWTISGDDNAAMEDDAKAIDWLNENVTECPTVVLEADGSSYSFGNRISVFTGQPTILGWQFHEWLWRADMEHPEQIPKEQQERQEEVKTIYTSSDSEQVGQLLEKYNVSYIVIGYNEYKKAEEWGTGLNIDGLMARGEVVFESHVNADYPLYIIEL